MSYGAVPKGLDPNVEMKPSGVEWIGEIPAHWEIKRLKRVAKILPSNVDKHIYPDEVQVRLCNYTDVYYNDYITVDTVLKKGSCKESEFTKFALRKGDVIITKDSETPDDIGVPTYVKDDLEDVVCGYHLTMIRPFACLGEFVFRFIQSDRTRRYFEVSSNGITRYGLGKSSIENLLLPIPTDSEQRQIANFLDRKTKQIDELIRIKERQIELLQEQRTALINQVVTKGLDPNVEMKSSGVEWIGEIPAHWKVINTKYLFRLVTEPAPENNNYELLSIYTSIGVRPRKELEERGNRATTTDGYWLVKKGDFIVNKLLAWMGAIGLSNYEGVTSPAYDILRKSRPLNERFYEYLFRCGLYFPEFKKRSRGIMEVRLRLYFDQFGQIPLVFPPVHEQDKITNFLDHKTGQIDELITAEQRKIELLKEYRQSLISEAVTGKIDVRNDV